MKKIPDIRALHHVLVCRGEGSLENAIVSSCCYREIKKANPHVKITVACFGGAYEFLKHNPYVDEAVKLPVGSALRPNQRWFDLMTSALQLRRRHFDLVLDGSGKSFWNWRLFKWIAGGNKVLDRFTSPVRPFGAPEQHGSEHEMAILRQLGIAEPDGGYDLFILPSARACVAKWLEGHGFSHYILFNPAAEAACRQFQPDVLKEICAALKGLNMPVIVPAMTSNAVQLRHILEDIKDVFVVQPADVFELFEWVRRSALVITPDTAVVHIAAGFSKPTVAFYMSTDPFYMPNHPKAKVLQTEETDINRFDWWQLESALAQFKAVL